MNLDTKITLLAKINSKLIINLNIKCKTKKLVEDEIGENLDDFVHVNGFFFFFKISLVID